VTEIKPSRCDLAADFLIPGGLEFAFLKALHVPRNLKSHSYFDADALETFYFGGKASPIQLRIYDKAKEVKQGGTKFWFLDIWGVDECRDVWRVEFQMRRPVLREFGINSIDDLLTKIGGLWQYLTTDWFTLRQLDSPNTSRRSVHPFWQVVQQSPQFGDMVEVQRKRPDTQADVDWYVNHIDGCLVGLAARMGAATREEALAQFADSAVHKSSSDEFRERVTKACLKQGLPIVNADSGAGSLS